MNSSGMSTPAEGEAEVTYAIQKLEQLLTCPICLDRYRNPKLLPCQHTFCYQCLEGCEDIVRRQVKCPECRAEHHIPFKGLDFFPNNLTLAKFLEIPVATLALPAPTAGGEMAEVIEKFAHYGQCTNCEENANLSKCAHCNNKICGDCKHGHIDGARRETVRLINQGKRTIPRLIEAIDSLTVDANRQKTNLENIKQDIQDTCKRVVKDVQDRENLMLMQVENVQRSENTAVVSQLEMLEQEKVNLGNLTSKYEDKVRDPKSNLSDEELINLKRDLFESLEIVRQLSLDVIDQHARVRFVVDYEHLKTQLNQFGEIKIAGGRPREVAPISVPQITYPEPRSSIQDSYTRPSGRASPYNRPSYFQSGGGDSDSEMSFPSRRISSDVSGTGTGTNRYSWEGGSRYGSNRDDLSNESTLSGRLSRLGERDRDREETHITTPTPIRRNAGDSTLAIMMRYGQTPNLDGDSPPRYSAGQTARDSARSTPAGDEERRSGHNREENRNANRSTAEETRTPSAPENRRNPDGTFRSRFLRPKENRDNNDRTEGTSSRDTPQLSNATTEDVPSTSDETRPRRSRFWRRRAASPEPERPKETKSSPGKHRYTTRRHTLGSTLYDKEGESGDDEEDDKTPTPSSSTKPSFTSEDAERRRNRWSNRSGSASQDVESSIHKSRDSEPSTPKQSSFRGKTYDPAARARHFESFEEPSTSSGSRYSRSNTAIYKGGSNDTPQAASSSSRSSRSGPRNDYTAKTRSQKMFGNRGTEVGRFTWPRGIAINPWDSSIVVADSSNHRVQVFDSSGIHEHSFGSHGKGQGEFDGLAGVAVSQSGLIVVSDRYNHRIQVFDNTGRFLRSFGREGAVDGLLNYPWGICSDNNNKIYVCDKENHRVQIFSIDGAFIRKIGSRGSGPGQFEHPHYCCVHSGLLYVSDSSNHRVKIFETDGTYKASFGGQGMGEGQFNFPRGIAVDNEGYIIVGDSGNNRIQVFKPDRTFYCSFGSWGSGEGQLKGLEGLGLMSNGNIVVSDRENHRVQIF